MERKRTRFYLLGVVVVIGVIGLRAEYSAVTHGQFLRTTLEVIKKIRKKSQIKFKSADNSDLLRVLYNSFFCVKMKKKNAPSSTEEMTPVCRAESERKAGFSHDHDLWTRQRDGHAQTIASRREARGKGSRHAIAALQPQQVKSNYPQSSHTAEKKTLKVESCHTK